MKAWLNILFFLLTHGGALRAEDPSQKWLSEQEKVRWLGGNYGPAWIEQSTVVNKKPEQKEPSPGAQLPSLWLPMCFFFDASLDQTIANLKVKTLVQAYGACGIAVETYTFTLRSDYPNSAKALRTAAEKACPFSSMGVRGAIQIETRFPDPPKQMCEDGDAEGCSTLCSPISVSIVKPNAGPTIGLHESLHSNCCGPVCVDKGEGTGVAAGPGAELATSGVLRETYAAKNVRKAPPLINEDGCAALRAGASPNNFVHWYEPERKEYVTLQKDPAQQKDLLEGKNLLPTIQMAAYELPMPPPKTSPKRSPAAFVLPEEKPKVEEELPAPPPPTRAEAAVAGYPEIDEGDDQPEPRNRKRGASLRKGNDSSRKKSNVGVVDAYSAAPE